ncbi:MAG: hypothetical protein ACXWUG_13380 [Polyangiales bacterium]
MRRVALLIVLTFACRRAPELAKRDPTPPVDASKPEPEVVSTRALLHGNVVELTTGQVVFAHAEKKLPRDEKEDIVLEDDDTLRAIDLSTGAQRWSTAVSCKRFSLSKSTVACGEGPTLVIVDRKTGAATRLPSPTGKTDPIDEIVPTLDHFVLRRNFELRVVDARGTSRASTVLSTGPLSAFSNRTITTSPDGYCFVSFDPPDFAVRCFDLDTKPLRVTKLVLSKPTDPPFTRMMPLVLGPHHVVVGTFSFGGFPAARRAAIVRVADGALVATVEDEVVALAERSDGTLDGLVVVAPEIRLLEPSGKVRWKHPSTFAPPMGTSVVDDDRLILATYNPIATGVQVFALRLADGTEVWKGETKLPPIGHSKYRNDVTLGLRGGAVLLRGEESAVHHVHLFDAKSGALHYYDAPPR